MRLKSRLVEFASVGLLVAFAASETFAQGTPSGAAGSGGPEASKSSGASGSAGAGGAAGGPSGSANVGAQGKAGASASQGPWTANNVTAARPFGDIDIQAAGSTSESVRTWVQTRTAAEREELRGRCEFISDPANTSRYPMNAQTFCRNYMMVSLNAPAGSNPAGVPGAASTGQSGGQLGGSAGGAAKGGAAKE